jgi:PTH2 family peptidyl-tRNA hydrolase
LEGAKVKQVILVPMWLKMSPGKVASQVAHAAVAVSDAYRHEQNRTLEVSARVVLAVPTLEVMLEVLYEAAQWRLRPTVFRDEAPTTQDTEGRVTAVVITANDEVLQKITGHLELY